MKSTPSFRPSVSILLVLAAAAVSTPAHAVPALGTDRPEVTLRDAWERTTALSHYRGMPILVIYEDKGSATQNDALKSELARLARGDKYKQSIALVAVADVSAYDYWPVRGFVKDAIRGESRKQNTTIYCDWDGRFRAALSLDAGASNVVLFDRGGKVVFAQSGALSADQRAQLLALLRTEVERA